MIKKIHFSLLLTIALYVSTPAHAQTNLSNKALFYRCYTQLTGAPLMMDSTYLSRATSGEDAIDLCLEIMDAVQLSESGGTLLPTMASYESKRIFNNFHRLHSDWFEHKGHFNIGTSLRADNRKEDIYDSSEPALYYTRSLFAQTGTPVPIDTVLTASVHLRPVRTTTPTEGLITKAAYSAQLYDTSTPLASTGELLGIVEAANIPYAYSTTRASPLLTVTGNHYLFSHLGGGILGNQTYLLKSVREEQNFMADNAMNTPRTWAKLVFKDLLCRTLPVVRPADSASFVVPESTVAFRQGASCTQCHASMDRMASTLRNFQYLSVPGGGTWNRYGPWHITTYPVTQTAESGWPSEPDPLFYARPTNGTLFYRNIHGQLINQPVTSVAQVGNLLAAQDDFYVCVASRYYEHFTGIKVILGDSGTSTMPTETQKHFDRVVQLGQSLRQHKNPRLTIRDILESDDYKKINFGLGSP